MKRYQATKWLWHDASVQTKLTAVTTGTTIVGLLMAFASIVALQFSGAKRELARELGSIAQLVAGEAAAAVQFRDAAAAQEALDAFRDTGIEAARIDLTDGAPFALLKNGSYLIPRELPPQAEEEVGGRLVVSRPILLNGDIIGAARVQGSLAPIYSQIRRYLLVISGVLTLAGVVGFVLARRLQRVISGPILRLGAIATRVSRERDYSLRGERESEDEIGQLVERFNDMLTQIEHRDEALREAQAQLEGRVRERTATLELEIIEHRRTENALIVAKAAAEQASAAKSAFLANMSHELRTPLNAIIGYSEMLREEAQAAGVPSQAEDLSKIINAGRHLLSLITEVLDFSKIEAGRMEVHAELFDAAELVRTVVETSLPLAAARENRLSAVGLDALGIIKSDRTKVQQVLLNLVGNACKFTSAGDVRLECAREREGETDWIAIGVRDTGIGMTPEQMSRLFREFVQADQSMTRKYGGTGLGLAISQRLSHLLGGDISVASEIGRGSTFTMRLPAVLPASGSADAAVNPLAA